MSCSSRPLRRPCWRRCRSQACARSGTGFILDAVEQALHDRRPQKGHGAGSSQRQGLAIPVYSLRLNVWRKPGSNSQWASVGDSYDNALAEMINGPFKAEVISRRGSWRSVEAVEYATLGWVDWFNNCLLLEPIRNILLAEAEADFYEALETDDIAA